MNALVVDLDHTLLDPAWARDVLAPDLERRARRAGTTVAEATEAALRSGALHTHLYYDAWDHLDRWTGRGLRLFVLTPDAARARLELAHTGRGDLLARVEAVVEGDAADPSTWTGLLAERGIAADQAGAVLASAEHVAAAAGAGLQAVLMDRAASAGVRTFADLEPPAC